MKTPPLHCSQGSSPARRRAASLLALLACIAFPAAAGAETVVSGFLATRALVVDAPTSWIDGGYGRLLGGDGSGDWFGPGAEARLQLDANHESRWAARLAVGARSDRASGGRHVGLIEAFVDRRWTSDIQQLQLRAGMFFLPSSLENIERHWVSPYTLTHSAINSWMGEEFRPIGLDVRWRRQLQSGRQLELGASVLQSNDASGAFLAWRGFALHDRLSFYGETLPLPDLFSLRDPALFGEQNAGGTKPFGPDLDGRPGYALRIRHGNALSGWQINAVDTRGDLLLHRGEYAWRTRFVVGGWEFNPAGQGWSHAAEVLVGTTRMGVPGFAKAGARMRSAYWLSSFGNDPWRYTVRLEAFDIDDIDRSIGEDNRESGNAVALAALRQLGDWRLGIEWLLVDGNRPAAADEGAELQAGGTQIKLEARYSF